MTGCVATTHIQPKTRKRDSRISWRVYLLHSPATAPVAVDVARPTDHPRSGRLRDSQESIPPSCDGCVIRAPGPSAMPQASHRTAEGSRNSMRFVSFEARGAAMKRGSQGPRDGMTFRLVPKHTVYGPNAPSPSEHFRPSAAPFLSSEGCRRGLEVSSDHAPMTCSRSNGRSVFSSFSAFGENFSLVRSVEPRM